MTYHRVILHGMTKGEVMLHGITYCKVMLHVMTYGGIMLHGIIAWLCFDRLNLEKLLHRICDARLRLGYVAWDDFWKSCIVWNDFWRD